MPMRFLDNPVMHALVSPLCFFGLSSLWVFGVFALVDFMMKRKRVQVKHFMRIYNVVQIVVCSYMVWGLSPCIGIPNFFGLNSEFDERGEWFCFVHYMSKYLDWFDTLWIILNKKRSQLSFLHVYHHGTIVATWGMALHTGVGNGTARYGGWINSLTHVFMYTHYLWTSFGYRNPFKRWLTMWQISQFYSCFLHAVLVLALDRSPAREYAWIQLLYQITMVYLFSKQMAYVPGCIPDFNASKGETPMSCTRLLSGENPQEGHAEMAEPDTKKEAYGRRYVVIRGSVYDLTTYEHPGGMHMLDLAVGRDATIMFESTHTRMEVAEKALELLPKYSLEEMEKKGYDFGCKETAPTPGKSELYHTLRKRVVEEVLKPRGYGVAGKDVRGVPPLYFVTVIAAWVMAVIWFYSAPSILSGATLGFTLAWMGLSVQHNANHGSLTSSSKVNYLLSLLDDIAVGGSSIVGRYHHQVSHHVHCNNPILDQDLHFSYPLLRLHSLQPWRPHHRYQWLYAPVAYCFLWVSSQFQDTMCLFEAKNSTMNYKGTGPTEITKAVLLKCLHFWWLVVVPYQLHGLSVILYPLIACFGFGSFALTSTYIVSHHVNTTKSEDTGDWARQQIERSTSWGGAFGCFMSGGQNLRIEHHLFPCIPFHLYSPVQEIVMDECFKRGIRYNRYPTLLGNFVDHEKFLYAMGQNPGVTVADRKNKKKQ